MIFKTGKAENWLSQHFISCDKRWFTSVLTIFYHIQFIY